MYPSRANQTAIYGGGGSGGGAGTVTSVGLTVQSAGTSGIFTANGTPNPVIAAGTLNIDVAGTSGGIPYFSSATVLSTSAVLTANSPILGGGAGTAPSTKTFLTTDGVSVLTVGVVGAAANGAVAFKGLTSGTFTLTSDATSANLTASGNVIFPNGAAGSPSAIFRAGCGIGSYAASTLALNTVAGGNIDMYAAAVLQARWALAATSLGLTMQIANSSLAFNGNLSTGVNTTAVILGNNAGNPLTGVSGNVWLAETRANFAPASGPAAMAAHMVQYVVNQTGTSSGTIRGLGSYAILTAVRGTVNLLALGTGTAVGPTTTLTDLYLINQTGQVTKYKGSATVERGHAYNLGSIILTNQTAALGATSLSAGVPATGFYRVSVYAKVTQASAGGTSALGGTVGAVLNYLDGTDSVSENLNIHLGDQAGAGVSTATGNTANTTQTVSQGSAIVYIGNASPVTISFGYATTVGTMAYTFQAILEAL